MSSSSRLPSWQEERASLSSSSSKKSMEDSLLVPPPAGVEHMAQEGECWYKYIDTEELLEQFDAGTSFQY